MLAPIMISVLTFLQATPRSKFFYWPFPISCGNSSLKSTGLNLLFLLKYTMADTTYWLIQHKFQFLMHVSLYCTVWKYKYDILKLACNWGAMLDWLSPGKPTHMRHAMKRSERCEVRGPCGSYEMAVDAASCVRGICFFWGSMGASTVLSPKVTGCGW